MSKRKTAEVNMTVEEWSHLQDIVQRWAYSACRSDIGTDHPLGVKVLDPPFNELRMRLCLKENIQEKTEDPERLLEEVASRIPGAVKTDSMEGLALRLAEVLQRLLNNGQRFSPVGSSPPIHKPTNYPPPENI